MMVLVGITLLGHLLVELKIVFYVWHGKIIPGWARMMVSDLVLFSSGPGSSGITSPSMNASPEVQARPVVLGITFFRAPTYASGPGFGQVLITTH